MADDETHVRALIERWARSVHGGDMDGVLADHADNIVMLDVPPPNDDIRGIDVGDTAFRGPVRALTRLSQQAAGHGRWWS